MVEVDDGRVVRSGEVLTIMIGGFGPQSGQETRPYPESLPYRRGLLDRLFFSILLLSRQTGQTG